MTVQARREIATRKLHALVPEIGKLARTMALEETDFDTDRAVELLRRFQDKHGTELATLHERRVQFLKGRERRKNGSDVGKFHSPRPAFWTDGYDLTMRSP